MRWAVLWFCGLCGHTLRMGRGDFWRQKALTSTPGPIMGWLGAQPAPLTRAAVWGGSAPRGGGVTRLTRGGDPPACGCFPQFPAESTTPTPPRFQAQGRGGSCGGSGPAADETGGGPPTTAGPQNGRPAFRPHPLWPAPGGRDAPGGERAVHLARAPHQPCPVFPRVAQAGGGRWPGGLGDGVAPKISTCRASPATCGSPPSGEAAPPLHEVGNVVCACPLQPPPHGCRFFLRCCTALWRGRASPLPKPRPPASLPAFPRGESAASASGFRSDERCSSGRAEPPSLSCICISMRVYVYMYRISAAERRRRPAADTGPCDCFRYQWVNSPAGPDTTRFKKKSRAGACCHLRLLVRHVTGAARTAPHSPYAPATHSRHRCSLAGPKL